MRTRAKVASVLSSVAVLVLGGELGAQAIQTTTISNTASAADGTSSSSGSAGADTGSDSADDSSGSSTTATPTSTSTSTDDTSAGSTDTSDTGSTGSGSSDAASSSGVADGTHTGDSVDTRFGSVQVSVTISGGEITDRHPRGRAPRPGCRHPLPEHRRPDRRPSGCAAGHAPARGAPAAAGRTGRVRGISHPLG